MVNTRSGRDYTPEPERPESAEEEDGKKVAFNFNPTEFFQFTSENVFRFQALYHFALGVMMMFFQEQLFKGHGTNFLETEAMQATEDADPRAAVRLMMTFRGMWKLSCALFVYAISTTRTIKQCKAVLYCNFMMGVYFACLEFLPGSRSFWMIPDNMCLIHACIYFAFVAAQCYAQPSEGQIAGDGEMSMFFKIWYIMGLCNFVGWVWFADKQAEIYTGKAATGMDAEIWERSMRVCGLSQLFCLPLMKAIGMAASKFQMKLMLVNWAAWGLLFVNLTFIQKDLAYTMGQEGMIAWAVIAAGMSYMGWQQTNNA